jgi:hypothetical protein
MTGDGNLIVLLGLGDDALGTALEMSIAAGGSDVRTAGAAQRLRPPSRAGKAKCDGGTRPSGADWPNRGGRLRTRTPTRCAARTLRRSRASPPTKLWMVVDARAQGTTTPRCGCGPCRACWRGSPQAVDALAVIGASETSTPRNDRRAWHSCWLGGRQGGQRTGLRKGTLKACWY